MPRTVRTSLLAALILSLPCPALPATAPTTGSISGLVLDSAGLPVADAVVEYHRAREFIQDSAGHIRAVGPIVDATVKTDASGTFAVAGLPPGTYGLCAAGALPAQLRSCDWRGSQPPLTVTAGQTTRAPVLTLRAGVLVVFEVSDPNAKIAGGAYFFGGVISDSGEYQPAIVVAKTATSLSLRVPVPATATVYLLIDTPLKVTDQNGNLVPTRVRGPQVSLGTVAQVAVSLNVQ